MAFCPDERNLGGRTEIFLRKSNHYNALHNI